MLWCSPSRAKLLSAFGPSDGIGTARLSAAPLSEQTVAGPEHGTSTGRSGPSESTVFHSRSIARPQYAPRIAVARLHENQRARSTAVQVLDLWQGLQAEEHTATARTHTHRFTAVRLFRVRQTLSPAIAFDAASPDPCQWQAVQLCVLLTKFSPTCYIESASSHPLGWEAVFLFRVRQTLSPESNPQSTCANPSRRATQLLNATFLHLFCYKPKRNHKQIFWNHKKHTYREHFFPGNFQKFAYPSEGMRIVCNLPLRSNSGRNTFVYLPLVGAMRFRE